MGDEHLVAPFIDEEMDEEHLVAPKYLPRAE